MCRAPLLNTLIAPSGLTIIRDADLDVRAIDAACRRTFYKERLATMLDGGVETVYLVVLANLPVRAGEAALRRRPVARLTRNRGLRSVRPH